MKETITGKSGAQFVIEYFGIHPSGVRVAHEGEYKLSKVVWQSHKFGRAVRNLRPRYKLVGWFPSFKAAKVAAIDT